LANSTDPLPLIGWLAEGALAGRHASDILDGLGHRLNEAGVPLSRVAVGSGLLHPTFDALGMFWRRGKPVQITRSERLVGGPDDDDGWLRSPWHLLVLSRTTSLRRRLEGNSELVEFPVLGQLRKEGATDYLARVEHLGAHARMGELDDIMSSWTTDRPGGFTDADLALLESVVPVFAMAYHSRASMVTAKTLLTTYLGNDAARRVLGGNIVRGRAEIIRAVVWYSDLANFTRIADEVRHEEVLALLNDYAECLIEILDGAGGQVLKLVGDGILAIFPEGHGNHAADRALAAAAEAERGVAKLNGLRAGQGKAVTDFYLALHVGELLYGNFGSSRRLDFSVLGPAVNEASRMAQLCRSIDQRIVVSSTFAHSAEDRRRWLVSLGRYALKGVGAPQELFTLDRGASGA
jgi:adenylate cyclase